VDILDLPAKRCARCGGDVFVTAEPATSPHWGRATCSGCGRFVDWVRKPTRALDDGPRVIGADEVAEFERCSAHDLSASGKALEVTVAGDSYWVPLSQIREGSDIREPGSRGSLIVSMWWAERSGLIGGTE